jgi:hypothetical protein
MGKIGQAHKQEVLTAFDAEWREMWRMCGA